MALIGNMELELVKAVGVIVTRVASKLNGIGNCQELQFPLIFWTSFFDVVDMVESLKMFVCFAVKLEVGFQVGLVAAQLADVVGSNDDGNLMLPHVAPVHGQVLRHNL